MFPGKLLLKYDLDWCWMGKKKRFDMKKKTETHIPSYMFNVTFLNKHFKNVCNCDD